MDKQQLDLVLASTPEKFERLYFFNNTVELIYDDKLHAYYVMEDGVRYLVPGATTVCGVLDKSGALTQWSANMTTDYLRAKLLDDPLPWTTPNVATSLIDTPEKLDTLLNEARFNFRTVKQTAADIGHIAHDWLERRNIALIAGEDFSDPLPENEKACNAIRAALEWQDKHNFRPIEAERKVFSKDLCSAGTFDWIAWITGCGEESCCGFSGEKLALGDYKSSKAIYNDYRLQTAFYKKAYQEENDVQIECRVILHIDKEDGEFDTLILHDEEGYELDLAGFCGLLAAYNWTLQLKMDKKYAKDAARAAAAALKPPKKTRKVAAKPLKQDEDLIPIAAA